MRIASFSGLAGLAALMLSSVAATAQVKFVSVGHGSNARSAEHGAGFRSVGAGYRATAPVQGAGHASSRYHHQPARWHGGDHGRRIYRPAGYYPFEGFGSIPASTVVLGSRDVRADDGTASIRALFDGPLAAGATAAATYILLTQGPKAFGLEDDYRKAMQSLPVARRAAPVRRATAGPKIIRIGGQ